MKESDNNQAGQDGLNFVDKKTRFYQSSTYLTVVGKRNGNNVLLKPLYEYSLWTKEEIKLRQRKMAKLAVNLWKLDGREFSLDVTQ
jgi:hypothetical protein